MSTYISHPAESWQAVAQNEFDSWSPSYDESILQRLIFGPSHDRLLELAQIPPRARILDIGCGTGLLARRILGAYPTVHVVGLDLSDGMLEKAAENCTAFGDRLRLVRGDSEDLPFEDESFDLVLCSHSFHHYPRQRRVVEEMHRVLGPDGQLVLIDGDRDGFWGWIVFDWVVTTLEGMVHHCSARRFRELLAAAGFENVQQYHCGGLAPFLVNRAVAGKSGHREKQ